MIVITDTHFIPNEVEIINTLFYEGLEILHLRKPDSTAKQVSELISGIDSRFHSRIMIHSHYELLSSYQLKGMHFTENSKHLLDDFKNFKCVKSLAMHDLKQLKKMSDSIDYVLLSPLFPSISKPGYSKHWDFEILKSELSIKYPFHIVALGGITLNNINIVNQLGFDDFALLGSIWEPVKSGCSIQQVLNVFKSFKSEY